MCAQLGLRKDEMTRATAILCILAAAAAPAAADRVILRDGRSFTGTVTVKHATVEITMTYGTLQFSRDEVLRIERKETLESQLARMRKLADADDPDSLLLVGNWAKEHGLDRQAGDIFRAILALDPEHVGAHRGLKHVRIDKAWWTFAQAVELARSKLEAGQYRQLLDDVIGEMEQAASGPKDILVVRDLKADAQLRAGRFAEAYKTFKALSEACEGPTSVRYAAVAEILADNPDGMYVLREPQPPAATLVGGGAPVFPVGPASLAQPAVLQAALRDRAKKDIDAGKKLMAEAAEIESTDADAAKARYRQASKAFDRAEALVPRIAHSYKVEIARRKIFALRGQIEGDSASFDREMGKLGQADMGPHAYRNKIIRMIHSLDNVRAGLQNILEIAKPYPRELVLEVKWAEMDLKRIGEMRKILRAELDGEN